MARPKLFATLVITLLCLSTWAQASQRSIHLNPDGRYSGLVVGFSSDFVAGQLENTILRLMENLQNASNILNELIGYQFGEVTIVLHDDWTINTARLPANVTEAQFRPLSEADIIFTDDDREQILTMQSGECGEGGQPIQFPHTFMSDETIMPRLLIHQWLLYRYGVFNEFGYVSDDSYPVYFAPSDGGALNHSSASITSCSNKPEFNYTSQCHSQAIDPNTGRPVDPTCDVVPIEKSIQSSFLYAPLVVTDYKLCDKKTHDFVSPNKHNALCDYQSAADVISKHADFDSFKHQLAHQKKMNQPIQFKIWQKSTPIQPVASKSNMMYVFPSDYPHYESFLNIIKEVTNRLEKFRHQAKVRFFDSNSLVSVIDDWQPSNMISPTGKEIPIAGKVNLVNVIGQIVPQFHSAKELKISGTCLFVYSGNHEAESAASEQEVEILAKNLNDAGIGLRVVIVDRMPGQQVLSFFEQLNSKLVSESSVNYAISPAAASSPISNQVFSTVNTVFWDAIQDITENSHILLKKQTFNPSGVTINFTIDESFKSLVGNNYRVLVEVYTTGKASSLEPSRVMSIENEVKRDYFGRASSNVATMLYKGESMKPGFYRLEVRSTANDNPQVTVSIRVLANTNAYRSYHKDSPITARCWVRADASSLRQYPLRGYAQLSKGLNGPVYDADVSLIIHRFDTASQYEEYNIPLNDNGHGNPDITARDGIFSAYLNRVPQNSGPAAYSVFARVYSDNLSLKPGTFGNTVMFKNRPRCCGSDLGVKTDDEVHSGGFERLVSCGSFYTTGAPSNQNNYAIRDLRLMSIDAENRTITLQWSSPFIADQSKFPPEVKAFHSYTQHTTLPAQIKENFATLTAAETEVVSEPSVHSTNTDLNLYEELSYDTAPYAQMATMSNSLHSVTLRILSAEEGYYFVAVAEHADDGRKTKASNVLSVYMKSNVPLENTTALANDDSKLPEGTYRESLNRGSFTWWHMLIIGIGSLLLLVIIVLIVIVWSIRKRRHANNKQSHVDYEVAKKPSAVMDSDGKSSDGKPTQYYLNQEAPDASSVNSNSINERNGVPNSNLSNNTSCSSVNTVDNQTHGYMTPSHLEPTHRLAMHQHQHQHQHSQHSQHHQQAHTLNPTNMTHDNGGGSHQSITGELNVAQLMGALNSPNSYDAKELLDHWGRVQKAKQRQESPPVMQRLHTASPSIPSSFGGSSLDNYNHGYQYQSSGGHLAQPQLTSHYVHEGQHEPADYHQPSLYAPYSNASSIWQHQQQQQYQPQQYAGPVHHGGLHIGPGGYDNGLPEYSIVRKPQPNISQV